MHIPLKLLLSWVVSASMIFGTAVDENFLSAVPPLETGPATSVNNDDTKSVFKPTSSKISPSVS